MKLPNQSEFPFGTIFIVLIIIGLGAFFARSPESSTRGPNLPPMADSLPTPIGPSNSTTQLAATLPHPGGPEGYIGSESCVECHEKQHASWHQSYHRTMTQALTPETVRADFDDVTLEANGERFHLSETNGTYWVSISGIPQPGAPPPSAADSVKLQLAMMTGSHHMNVFWLPGVYGNMQIGFPFTWLLEDQRWVPRHDTFIRDPDTEPVVEVWNKVCIRCHTTGGIPKPNEVQKIFETEVTELGISCEACHGPAEEHVRLRIIEKANPDQALPAGDPIIQPANLSAERSAQVCGYCHSMKWFDKNEQWEMHGFRYRPGDDLNETTPVIKATNLEEQPWLEGILERNPGLMESFYWPDGMMRVSGREYNGLIESACHTKGELSCVSCHSLHSSDPDDMLARNRTDNQACTQCHAEIGQSLTEHTHHRPASSGSQCYNCHMPHTTYGILKAIRSHEIDSPDVSVEKATGRPNACNLCHVNQTLAWTASHLNEWYQQAPPELDQGDHDHPSIPRYLLSGNAAQRALAAWTLGWEPTKETSGTHWQAPVLAKALDDRYSAVRYIAGKSLSQQPGFDTFTYDFVGAPQDRKQAVLRALEHWTKADGAAASTNPKIPFFDASGHPREDLMTTFLEQQDQTPVRLRE